jgi:hypothetical protein
MKDFLGKPKTTNLQDKIVNVFRAFGCILQGSDRDLRPPGGMERITQAPPKHYMDFFRDYLNKKKGDLKTAIVAWKA